jgi:SAM-dependent methyltransferase
MSQADEIREYWDADSLVYDTVPHHHPTGAAEQAAWAAALADLLPSTPARVLDCGAGTGFLSIAAARLGHHVTAVDLSPAMLARLTAKAQASNLDVEIVVGPAEQPPNGPYDIVMERHVLWTLPDPAATLKAWRQVAPSGRLILFEGLWGAVDPLERLRRSAQELLARMASAVNGARSRPGHHAEYPDNLRRAMPLGSGTHPDALIALVREAEWPNPQLRRLRDVEWASALSQPLLERLLGTQPRFVVFAG